MMIVSPLLASAREFVRAWSAFWFAPSSPRNLGVMRILIGAIAAIHFAAFLSWVPNWLTQDGWYDRPSSLYFIGDGIPGTGSRYRWSILYYWDTAFAATLLCLVGLASSLLTSAGILSRLAPLISWLCFAMISHRAPWLVMPSELLISAFMLYMVVDQARTSWSFRPAVSDGTERGTTTLVARMIQVHFVIWLWFMLVNMLQYTHWLNGTALTMLRELQPNSGLFGSLTDSMSQWLTHGVILLVIISIMAFSNGRLRIAGFVAMILYGFLQYTIVSDWLYALTLITMGSCFLLTPQSEDSTRSKPVAQGNYS